MNADDRSSLNDEPRVRPIVGHTSTGARYGGGSKHAHSAIFREQPAQGARSHAAVPGSNVTGSHAGGRFHAAGSYVGAGSHAGGGGGLYAASDSYASGSHVGSRSHAAGGGSSKWDMPDKKSMSRGKKIVLGVVIAIALIVAGTGIAAALYINSIANNLAFEDQGELDSLKEVLAPVDEEEGAEDTAVYALVLGSDAREGDTASRSDVMMLARLDPDNGIAELISIPRDTMVTIEGHGTNKINAAYAYGGAAGAVECVSEFAGVSISHYVEVHFDELEEVVDSLGGITVNIPEDIKAGNGGMSFSKGEQVINGKQALAFARERYNVSGGDFGRAQAQRMILSAIVEKVVSAPVTEVTGIVSRLSACVSTDYSLTDLIALAFAYKDAGLTMYTAACPSYSYNVGGVSYVATMFDEWHEMMQRVDASLDPDGDDPIPEEQANNEELGAATNSPAPHDYESLAANAALSTDDVASVE